MVVQGTMIGVLNLSHSRPRAFSEDDLRLLRLYGGLLAAALERQLTERHLRRQAVCDRLTGLYGRRHFLERLSTEVERARRSYDPFSLLFIDVDDLESFNNRYGHQAGDRVLVEIGKVLGRWCRTSDIVARYAGEEFVILMPATNSEEAALAAERLRKCIEGHGFPQKRRITVSLGAAAFPEDAENDLDLIAKAEQALYMAKRNGRNQALAFHALAVH
jgi:diguanylate cyclase (GGDEF)-like protein